MWATLKKRSWRRQDLANGLSNLIKKEIKEMVRDPKILLPMVLMPLIIFPLMGEALNISTSAIEESLKGITIAILNQDHGPMDQNLTLAFNAMNISLVETAASSVDAAIDELQQSNTTTLVVIPYGFSQNLTSGQKGQLAIYSVFRSISLSEGARSSVADIPINMFEGKLVLDAVSQAFPNRDPQTVLDPISVSNYVILKGRVIDISPDVLSTLFMSQSIGFPMVIMLLLISAMQIAATTVSIEKEEKTLETLLTLPISRLGILTGKLAGSVVVAAAGAVASIIGVNYYMGSAFGLAQTSPVDMEALGLTLSPTAYVLLAVTMFVTIVSALALAICIAAFSENVRSAQSLIAPLNILIVVPSMVLMFADIDILPAAFQAVMYAIPYTHAILASKAAFMADYLTMLRGIAYISVFTIVVLYIAAKIFTTEKIITARISLRRRRRKRVEFT
jgi:ABC-2 type transport system permease protein